MKIKRMLVFVCVAAVMGAMQPTCHADLVAGSLTFLGQADQSIEIVEGGPLTGPPFNLPGGAVFPFSAVGDVSLGWGNGFDDGGSQSATVTSFSATFFGTQFGLPYTLEAVGIGPGAGFSSTLTNIVDTGGANGQLVSADWSVTTTFSLTFSSLGATIYTRDSATFVGVLRPGAAGLGDVFSSPERVNGYLLGSGADPNDPSDDLLSAVSFDRTVTAVPEPGTAGLLCMVSVLVCLRRRK